jgi:hypothetical protein
LWDKITNNEGERMREPKYLSPTSISKWRKDRQEFYLSYLADNRPPRIPQNQPMSIGAGFDAYIKAYLHSRLFGPGDPKFEFATIFESQVEPQNRDWAKIHGAHVFSEYRASGALANLMLELADADGPPKFEFRIEGRVAHSACVEGIPLLGIPDISFYNKHGNFFEYDWKVNGYCSPKTTSPKKGYVRLFADGGNKGPHKDAHLLEVNGVLINIAHPLEDVDLDWANQLCIYSWISGAEIGSRFIVGIDQIVAKGSGTDYPVLRIACHRNRISAEYQESLHNQIAEIWTRIQRGAEAIFDDMTEDESKDRCAVLDRYHKGYEEEHKDGDWFSEATRDHRNF